MHAFSAEKSSPDCEAFLAALTDLSCKYRILIVGMPALSDMEQHDHPESYGTNNAHELIRVDLSMVA